MKTLSRGLSIVTLLAWGALMLYFYFSGRLAEYLIPAYRPLVAVSGFLMVGIAACLVWSMRMGARWQLAGGLVLEDRGDDLSSPNRVRATQVLAFGLLVLPMWAAVGVSKDQFSASAMLNRGIVSDAASLPGKSSLTPGAKTPVAPSNNNNASVVEPPLPGATPIPADTSANAPALDASQYLKTTANGHLIIEVTDLLFAAEDDGLRPSMEGKMAEVIGQFMPSKDDAGGTRFQLVRMFMVCCAADARPVAVAVEKPAAPAAKAATEKLNELGWVRVVGKITFPLENGRRVALLRAETTTPTDPPTEAMLY